MCDVLLVDDEPAVLRLLQISFRAMGLSTATAANGLEALQQVEDVDPAAVVVDLQMPVMNGETFVHELRQRQYATPVVVVSALSDIDVPLDMQADAFVRKPFHPDVLVQEVMRLIPDDRRN